MEGLRRSKRIQQKTSNGENYEMPNKKKQRTPRTPTQTGDNSETMFSRVPQLVPSVAPWRKGWLRSSVFLVAAVLLVMMMMVDQVGQKEPNKRPPAPVVSHKGAVLKSHSSPTYWNILSLQTLRDLWHSRQQWVLEEKEELQTGHCWSFPGSRGHLHIELEQPTIISDITVGHISKDQSPSGRVTSAPRVLMIYGMEVLDGPETFLGLVQYDENGPDMQTFAINGGGHGPFSHVRINVQHNWGNEEFTCMYHVGVHGKPAPAAP